MRWLIRIPVIVILFALPPALAAFIAAEPSRKWIDALNSGTYAALFFGSLALGVLAIAFVLKRFCSFVFAGILFWICVYAIAEVTQLGIILDRPKSFNDVMSRALYVGFFFCIYIFVFRSSRRYD